MRPVKLSVLFVLISVVAAFCLKPVSSKQGPIDLMKKKGGGGAVCTAPFGESMKVLKKAGDYALVKASCGQGWVAIDAVSQVAQGPGNKSMNLDDVDIVGWLDNPDAVFVLEDDAADFGGINIDRNFRDRLRHTVDKERIERRNNEN